MNDLIIKLAQALRDAHQHLEYCGYGDRWERECAYHKEGNEMNLPEKIAAALDAAEKAGF